MSGTSVPSGTDLGRDGRRGHVRIVEVAPGSLDRGGQGVDHLFGEVGGLAGGGAAQLEQRGVPGRLGRLAPQRSDRSA